MYRQSANTMTASPVSVTSMAQQIPFSLDTTGRLTFGLPASIIQLVGLNVSNSQIAQERHGKGEYARDDDNDGIYKVHVNTMESSWPLLRSWLRPDRGISQEALPLYLGCFEFLQNIGRRGKSLLQPLVSLLVSISVWCSCKRSLAAIKSLALPSEQSLVSNTISIQPSTNSF